MRTLVFVCVFFICAAGSCSIGLLQKAQAQEIKPEDAKAIPPLDTKSDIERHVEKLVKIHEFCWEHKGCTVIPKDLRLEEQKEMETLRRRVMELERPKPGSGCS